eukprot:jgi/Orpsp1_1/1184332/evm.model.c7180000089116.1
MKLLNSVLLLCSLFLTQAFFVYSSPIKANKVKRTPLPFESSNSEIYFYKPENWGDKIYAYVYSNDANNQLNAQWPGFVMNKRIIFTDGTNQSPAALQEGFDLVMEAVYDQTGVIGISSEKPLFYYNRPVDTLNYGNIAKVFYRPSPSAEVSKNLDMYHTDLYIHYKAGNGEWNDAQMEYDPYTLFYSLVIDLSYADDLTLAFTDGNGNWDNNEGLNYHFDKFSNFFIDNYNY